MNDTITILIKEESGFWDPYSSFLRFEVDVSDFPSSNLALGI